MKLHWPVAASPDHGDIMAAEIRLFPCLTDNSGLPDSRPRDQGHRLDRRARKPPIVKALEREGWTLTVILIHPSSRRPCRACAELKQKYNCRVVAPPR